MQRATHTGPAKEAKPAAIYLPIFSLRGGGKDVTLFSRKDKIYPRRADAEAALQKLPAGKRAVAEVVTGDEAALTPTLALGDIQELLKRVPKIRGLQERRPHNWREFILSSE